MDLLAIVLEQTPFSLEIRASYANQKKPKRNECEIIPGETPLLRNVFHINVETMKAGFKIKNCIS